MLWIAFVNDPEPEIKSMDDVLRIISGGTPNPDVQRAQERARREQLKADRRWHDYLCDHPQDQYPAILEKLKDLMPTDEWCKEIRFAWYSSDVLMNNREVWTRIFSDRSRIVGIATAEEAAHFARDRRDPLTIYRGCLRQHVDGMSWSLTYDVADYFKGRAGLHGVIFSGRIRKQDVIAYICPNGEEFEVIALPEHISRKEIVG
jgi:hypothetical protein